MIVSGCTVLVHNGGERTCPIIIKCRLKCRIVIMEYRSTLYLHSVLVFSRNCVFTFRIKIKKMLNRLTETNSFKPMEQTHNTDDDFRLTIIV